MPRKRGDADPRWRSHLEPAPGELRIVQAWLNTGTGGRQELASVAALEDWLRRWRLLSREAKLEPPDLERATATRSALLALIGAGGRPADAVERLRRAAAAAPIHVWFGNNGSARFEPLAGGLAEALARLFTLVAMADATGTWRRLKRCAGEDCRAVFYDFSNGRAAKWCSARCGAKRSSATYRRRRRSYEARKRAGKSAAS